LVAPTGINWLANCWSTATVSPTNVTVMGTPI